MLTMVKKARLERGLTLAEAANGARISSQALWRIECGHQSPWPAVRARLSALYQVPQTQLFLDLDAAQEFLRRTAGEGAYVRRRDGRKSGDEQAPGIR